jgi:class 3 adenylate cyclase
VCCSVLTFTRFFQFYPSIFLNLIEPHGRSQIITNNNGILDKFIGDGMFAYFGSKDTKFDVPYRTIVAAIELRKIFDDIKNRHLKLWHYYFGFNPHTNIDLKCAIHVGDVVFGYWNSPSRV